jgi:hypothetical protein
MARTKFTAKKTKKEQQSDAEEELEEQRRLTQQLSRSTAVSEEERRRLDGIEERRVKRKFREDELEEGRIKRQCREQELDIEERELGLLLRREEAMFNRSLQTQGHDLELRKLMLQEKQLEHEIESARKQFETSRNIEMIEKAKLDIEKQKLLCVNGFYREV